jgi:hypothetical protein
MEEVTDVTSMKGLQLSINGSTKDEQTVDGRIDAVLVWC